MQHEFHEFASMFPLLEGKDLDDLIADIKEHGQREPIVMLDNKVLDGRNRYIACQRLGIKPRVRDLTCIDGKPLDYVWSQNVTRRHLNEAQRAIAIAKRVSFVEKGNKEYARIGGLMRQGLIEQAAEEQAAISNQADRSLTLEEAAKIANVSTRQIGRAKSILRHGSPEDIAAVEQGNTKIYSMSTKVLKSRNKENDEPSVIGRSGPGGYTRINIPEGYTAEEYTRKGLELEAQGIEPSEVHKNFKISNDTYRKMREIVLISDLEYLRPQDRKAADFALKNLNETNQTVNAYPAIEHIADRLWNNLKAGRRRTHEAAQARVAEFEKQVEIIAHIGQTELDIPYLSQEQAAEAVGRLHAAQAGLRRLVTQLKEFYNV